MTIKILFLLYVCMNNKCNLSFGSRINFISSKNFQTLFKNVDNVVDEPWTAESMKTASGLLGTTGINTCTAGCFSVKEKASLFHFSTEEKNFFTIDKFITKIFNMFKTEKCKSALIVGSKPCNIPALPGTPPDVNSENLFELIRYSMKNLNPSILAGHKLPSAGTNFIYDNRNDVYYINALSDVFDSNSYAKNIKDLKKIYTEIYILPKDKITFSG